MARVLTRSVGGFVGAEEFEEAGGDVFGAGGLFENDVDDVFAGEITGVAEEGFGAVVVFAEVEDEGVADVGPAGKGTGGFLDVVFGVVADAEGEEFHEFTRVVFVGMLFDVLVVVEVDEHAGVFGDGKGEGFVVADGILAEEVVLLGEEEGIFDGDGGADEEAVPEEGHFFFEGALGADHAVDPPELEFFHLGALGALFEIVEDAFLVLRHVAEVGGAGHPCDAPRRAAADAAGLLLGVERAGKFAELHGRKIVGEVLIIHEGVDGLLGAHGDEAIDFVDGAAEAGAAEKMGGHPIIPAAWVGFPDGGEEVGGHTRPFSRFYLTSVRSLTVSRVERGDAKEVTKKSKSLKAEKGKRRKAGRVFAAESGCGKYFGMCR